MEKNQEEEQLRRLELLGQEILKIARNELYLKMRYLDVALSSLRFQMDGEIGSIGTDGQMLYFHPGWLGRYVPDGSKRGEPGVPPCSTALSVRPPVFKREAQ